MMSSRQIVVVVLGLATGCGPGADKCTRVFDRLAALALAKDGKRISDRDKVVTNCRDGLKRNPEREKMLDCIIGITGETTVDKVSACGDASRTEREDRDRKERKEADRKIASSPEGLVLAKIGEFKDQMCACLDKACAQQVSDELTRWADENAAQPKFSEDAQKRAIEIGVKVSECMHEAMAR